jgi:hypothetical protein
MGFRVTLDDKGPWKTERRYSSSSDVSPAPERLPLCTRYLQNGRKRDVSYDLTRQEERRLWRSVLGCLALAIALAATAILVYHRYEIEGRNPRLLAPMEAIAQ